MGIKTCYICGAKAISREHAPAKCFFSNNHEKLQLITVPSCSKHNEDTSADDDYVRTIIVSCIGNNHVVTGDLTKRVIKRLTKDKKLTEHLLKTRGSVLIQKGDQPIERATTLNLDRDRFNKVIRKIAYALFFHEYKMIWETEVNPATEFFLCQDGSNDTGGKEIQEIKSDMQELEVNFHFKGNNPETFKYAFFPIDEQNHMQTVCIMKFYGNFEVWCFPVPDSNTPAL